MYGLVNQAIKDLVVTKFGDESWENICVNAQIPPDDFAAMQYYPDALTYGLVGAASKELGLAGETILAEFGKHWVLYTAKEGYGPMMDLFGGDFKTCLMNLNNLHARMGMTMPQLTPPRFVFKEESPTVYLVQYHSARAGLSPMVSGLLEGLAARHGVRIKVTFYEDPAASGAKTFRIEIEG